MIFDMESLFADAQEITVDSVSTNTIDLGATGTPINGTQPLKRDLGAGVAVPLQTQVVQAFVGLSALRVILEVDDDVDFSSPAVAAQSANIPVALLVPGYTFPPQYIPQGVNKRYVRLRYLVIDGPATAGAITSGLVTGQQTNM